MIKIPPFLLPGDTIGLVCPAGYMQREKTLSCIRTLQLWGYRVEVGSTVGGDSGNYFSGTDSQRLADLQAMLDDPAIKAVLCARGGYGVGRIVDQIDFSAFRKRPKWIVGFSDITVLHAHVHARYRISTLHAPMAGAFNGEGAQSPSVQSLKRALQGKKASYSCPASPYNRTGKAQGELVGGNLSLLAHLTGTASDISTKGKILFLEDLGEYLYQADRMLYQLRRSGKLDKLAGLVVGGFTDMKDTDRPFGKTIQEIIMDLVGDYPYPVCFDFPISHGAENVAVKTGVPHLLQVGRRKVTLQE